MNKQVSGHPNAYCLYLLGVLVSEGWLGNEGRRGQQGHHPEGWPLKLSLGKSYLLPWGATVSPSLPAGMSPLFVL